MSNEDGFTIPPDSQGEENNVPPGASQQGEDGDEPQDVGTSKRSAGKPGRPGRQAKDAVAQETLKPVAMEEHVPKDVPRTLVRFLETSGPGGDGRVTQVVNGVCYSYVRNEDVYVPNFVLSAMQDSAPAETDLKTGKQRRVPSYPYQVVR
ncbi:hypothetical protein JCM15519_16850 [Fundidesulfovibrio butyratiphilus]